MPPRGLVASTTMPDTLERKYTGKPIDPVKRAKWWGIFDALELGEQRRYDLEDHSILKSIVRQWNSKGAAKVRLSMQRRVFWRDR